MKILYDGSVFEWQKAGGISRYFTNLVSNLPDECEPVISLHWSTGLSFPAHPNLHKLQLQQIKLRPRQLSLFINRFVDQARLKQVQPDLLHPTYYSLTGPASLETYRCPVAVTVYDMIHELHPDKMKSSETYLPLQKKKMVFAADAVLCISENTRQDLLSLYPELPSDRVFVTYLASEISPDMIRNTDSIPSLPYFVYVGERFGYKNFQALLHSLASLHHKHQEVMLAVVGAPFTDAENQEITSLGLENIVVNMGFVDDSHLAKLYKHSLALVYPSLYEGFGIPPLEAMRCGTIVIAANCSCIPEVVGEAGLLFDPNNKDSLTDIIQAVINGSIDRDATLEHGRTQSGKFSWARTAKETCDIYKLLTS